MSQTIIGVFSSFEEAEAAQSRLEAEGLVRSTDMHVHSQNAGVTGSADTTRDVIIDRSAQTQEGVMGRVEHFFKNLFGTDDRPEEAGHYQEAVRRGGALLSVDVADAASTERVRDALYAAGAVDIDARVAQWRSAGYSGYDRAAPLYSAEQIAEERKAFPVVKESLEVGKRQVQTGGVRVYSRLTETPVSESVDLREEHASVERRAVDRPATEADLQGGSVEIRETQEQPVVAKTARVVEEVVVGKETSNRTETVHDMVRGTAVEVERTEGVDDPSLTPSKKAPL